MSVKIAIIGAGPYGLSVASALGADQAEVVLLGEPMKTWRTAMPEGMSLKSDGFASNLFSPANGGTLADFCRSRHIAYDDRRILVKLETFIDYGLDFQKRLVPNLDRREVASLRRRGDRFELTLDDGATIEAEKVIIAVGITHYAYIPPALLKLPPTKIAHCSAFRDLSHLAGKDVIVIGAGASAVEVACELARCGAKTRLMTRKDNVRFGAPPLAEEPSFWRRIRHPKSGLGPGLRSWLYCTIPGVFRLLPARLRLALLHHHLGPSAQHHLRETFERDVSVLPGHEVLRAESNGDGVALFCRDRRGDETIVHADYVIAATGYRTDCARLSFIDADMRDAIQHFDGYPLLSPWFESSVSGLFFVGLSSAGSFGPLMRFVYGAEYAAKRLRARLR